MNDQTSDSSGWLIAKILGVWAAVGITSWSEAASFAAFCFSCLLICDFLWKKIVVPLARFIKEKRNAG